MFREYETIFIARPNLTEDGLSEIRAKMIRIIRNMGGAVLKIEDWGKRKLAYRVQKNTKGFYYLFNYVGKNDLPQELERNLKITDGVIRYLTIKLNDSVDMSKIDLTADPPKIVSKGDEEDQTPSRSEPRQSGRGRYFGDDPSDEMEEDEYSDEELDDASSEDLEDENEK